MQGYLCTMPNNLAFMINYTSEKQIKIEEFVSSFEFKISPDNRWAKLAVLLP